MKAKLTLLPTLLHILQVTGDVNISGTLLLNTSYSTLSVGIQASQNFSSELSTLPFTSRLPTSTLSSHTLPSSMRTLTSQMYSISVTSVTSVSNSNTTHIPATSVASVTSSPTVNAVPDTEIAIVRARRISAMVSAVTGEEKIAAWLNTLGGNGKWPDTEVNYATGCDAQRANWPAGEHWSRIVVMSAAYHGGISVGTDNQWRGNPALESSISRAMDWWFTRDFTNDACLDNGSATSTACPCSSPGLWNTNWYSNVILIPNLVVQACLLVNSSLTVSQATNCSHIPTRGYSPFYRKNLPGFVSGANILDMSRIGIDQALRVNNATLLNEAFERIHNEMVIKPSIAIKADGIKPDGSFGQHLGLSYAGNYGKDYANAVLNLEEAALGTRFSAGQSSRDAFATLIDGDRWAVFRNTLTGVLHWDFSVLPRFISFPTPDNQATASIKLNLTQIGHVGQEWGSDIMTDFCDNLQENTSDANAGSLVGNRMFFSNDYMVHRGEKYVSTLKMYSTRTANTEWTNNQNPFGFHLADGTLFTYLRGNEYEDIAAAWDWNLIPGITTDYANTPLSGPNAEFVGVQSFVGGASTGSIGVAAFRYTNPYTKTFSFQKAYFFLDDDVQHIMIGNIVSTSAAPIYSVLDQKRRNGPIYLNGAITGYNLTTPVRTLWHDRVGYAFNSISGAHVLFQTGNKTGAWSNIGTSTQPPTTVNLFSAWIQHDNITAPIAYTAFPATDYDEFESKRAWAQVRTVQNDVHISAVQDDNHHTTAAVFWDLGGGSITVGNAGFWSSSTTISTNRNAIVIYRAAEGTVTVSDPSQLAAQLQVTITGPSPEGQLFTRTLTFTLPQGPGHFAGSSVTQSIF